MGENLDIRFPFIPYDPNRKVEPTPWLIEGLWQKGKINGVAGFEKSGKSRLIGWMLVGMQGSSVLGLATHGLPRTLYLCGEETSDAVNNRIKMYAELQGRTEVPDITFVDVPGMRLDLPEQRKWLIGKLVDGGYKLLVIDPMRRVHAADEDKSTQVAPINNELRRWSNQFGITIIFVHHTPKINDETDMDRLANWFRGSTDMGAILDTGQYVNRTKKDEVVVFRHGRFPPKDKIHIKDLGDPDEGGKGFVRIS